MKKIYLISAGIAAAMAFAACSDNINYGEGQGNVRFSTSVHSDMTVVSRALTAEDEAALGESTMVWISNDKGLIRRYNTLSELPTEPVGLKAGRYVAEGWAGDSVPASWDQRWFKAYVPFTVSDGQTENVEIPLKIANTAVSVVYEDGVADALRNAVMTVGHTGGQLVYEGENAGRRGYFMMPSTTKDLTYSLSGTQQDGSLFEFTDKIADVQPATEYVLTVKCTPGEYNNGGAYFTIEVDSHEILIESEVSIVAPPAIKGYDFDITKDLTGEKGTIGTRTIYITSAAEINSMLIESEALTAIAGGPDVNLCGMQDNVKAALESAGIRFFNDYDASTGTIIRILLDSQYTDNLENGTYEYALTATDVRGRTSSRTLRIVVSDAPVTTTALAADDLGIFTNRATVAGTIVKPGATTYGFKYRTAGMSNWANSVEVTPEGTELTATLTGLQPATTYEYAAFADDFVGTPCSFTTESAPQLANAGFEEWDTSSSAYQIFSPGGTKMWDSGNKGATTMPGAGSITTPDESVKHSGNYSAKLYSKFVGIRSIGKFAAGNIFYGEYLKTAGTDGVLGWGRPFTGRPAKVRLWAKYTPGTVDSNGAKNGGELKEGDIDLGIVYIALTDGTTFDEFEGAKWPFVIKTNAKERRLFDKTDERVLAYGEHVFETATAGDGLIEIEIPIEYYRTDIRPSNIVFVGSASKYGDYFNGGEGSTLWLDDIELVYE